MDSLSQMVLGGAVAAALVPTRHRRAALVNTVLWRVVAMTPDGYVIGDRSLVADTGPIHFAAYQSDTHALAQARHVDAVAHLAWFNHGFMRAQVAGDALVLSFVVAERDGDTWCAIAPREAQSGFRLPIPKGGVSMALGDMWTRIWQAPAGAAVPAPGR